MGGGGGEKKDQVTLYHLQYFMINYMIKMVKGHLTGGGLHGYIVLFQSIQCFFDFFVVVFVSIFCCFTESNIKANQTAANQ